MDFADNTQQSGYFTAAGSPAAVTVELGWQPRYVRFVTEDTSVFMGEYFEGMTAAYFHKTISHADSQISTVTTNGVTVSATGVTFGTGCQVASKVTRWVAIR